MLTEQVKVRSEGSIVATLDVQVAETLDEARELHGDDAVLRMVNAQHRADEANKARAKATEATPEQKALAKALKKLSPEQVQALLAQTK